MHAMNVVEITLDAAPLGEDTESLSWHRPSRPLSGQNHRIAMLAYAMAHAPEDDARRVGKLGLDIDCFDRTGRVRSR